MRWPTAQAARPVAAPLRPCGNPARASLRSGIRISGWPASADSAAKTPESCGSCRPSPVKSPERPAQDGLRGPKLAGCPQLTAGAGGGIRSMAYAPTHTAHQTCLTRARLAGGLR